MIANVGNVTAVALTIAGSDPSGGAGIQADLKTFHQFGVYGQAVIAVITVQNTQRVSRVVSLDPQLISEQIEAVITDMPPAAAKTGALGNAANVSAVARMARTFAFPLVVDPVMLSKHGARLITSDAEQALKGELLPCAALVTPNWPEAEALAGMPIGTENEIEKAARTIAGFGCRAVLIKGGHASGEPIDWLFENDTLTRFRARRIASEQTHGTGCTLSAAITALLATCCPLGEAVRLAKAYVHRAIETAPDMQLHFGGIGPVNHFAP